MQKAFSNPFSVTRAADFSDEQIHDYWVDLADDGGFVNLLKPRLEMPMLILGGKGSGKTHIMRYLSFPLQKLRHSGDPTFGIRKEGYLGIYMRCSGLNSARFQGKRHSQEVWNDIFAYYMELWFAQMAVETACKIIGEETPVQRNDSPVSRSVMDLFDDPSDDFPDSVQALGEHLRRLQRELDVAVNNCAIKGVLDVTIRATSGKLIFGVPQVLTSHYSQLQNLLFVYLIDEFENLTEPQQKLINTLMREKRSPCSFKVGARLWGVRTYSTFCADEDNKEGSEYEKLPLDQLLRADRTRYAAFARRLVVRRLVSLNMLANPPETDEGMSQFLTAAFERVSTEGLAEEATRFVDKYADRERPYFRSLRRILQQGLAANATPGISTPNDIESVIQDLTCPRFPLLEKLNIFILYQQWNSKRDLSQAAADIREDCREYLRARDTSMQYHDQLLHWKYDLLAQLRRECDEKQPYAGFETFVELSWGNPRHLLILLKHVLQWAAFKGERPFGDKPVSTKAQLEGVKEAAEWFYRDARMTGMDGKLILDAIDRLGTLFRSVRYSHKPSECSLTAFSYEPAAISETTRRLIDLAEKWLLIVYVGGQRDRNSKRVDMKFQLNRMLAPRWDISFSRRGVLPIPGDDLNSIFDPRFTSQFDQRLKVRIDRMNAPFFGSRDRTGDQQEPLPGMGR